MTIIDEIRAEFQKRFEKCQSVSEDDRNALDVQDYYRGKYTAYSEAISFINMLLQEQEKEQPVPTIMTNEMLMGEIKPKKKSNALFDKCVENCDPAVMKEVSDNVDKMLLEEAAKEYDEAESWRWEAPKYPRREAFEAGAEWQKAKMLKDNPVIMSVEDFQALIDSHAKRVEADYKEQMLKEAVEGTVMDFSSNRPRPQVDVLLDPHKYHTGDKVRIIIVKEEEA